jgi:hypothetical protein
VTRHYCDICGAAVRSGQRDAPKLLRAEGLRHGAAGSVHVQLDVSVVAVGPVPGPVDVCSWCVYDVLDTADPRPRQGEPS